MNTNKSSKHTKAFALISSIIILTLLVTIAIGISSISNKKQTRSTLAEAKENARANAKLALSIALSQLQELAGLDQRATATASILNGQQIYPEACDSTYPYNSNGSAISITADDYRSKWVGVWNTQNYVHATPDSKEFLQWLVSGSESLKSNIEESAIIVRSTDTNFEEDYTTIFEGAPGSLDSDNVIVPKVDLLDGSRPTGRYAYWTEDIGLKADLSWSETTSSDNLSKQNARLSATPGIDYSMLAGPLASSLSSPYSVSSQTWLENINDSYNLTDIPLLTNAGSNYRDWIRENRHHFDIGSLGVLADMKRGGLKRDLSLAFEMDDTKEAVNATNFNNQIGEFVGGNDGLNAPSSATGMNGHYERFLYRDTQASGRTFSNTIITSDGVLRGPNWWAMRDYANLYKRLSKSGDVYSMEGRSYFPNVSQGATPLMKIYESEQNITWDTEYHDGTYIYRPAQANYAPTYLGVQCLIGVQVINQKLYITLDPIFYIWNPYNIELSVPGLAIKNEKWGFPGRFRFWTKQAGATTETKHNLIEAQGLINTSSTIDTETGYFLTDPASADGKITMQPGEVMVFSPTEQVYTTPTQIKCVCTPGFFNSGFNNTGIKITDFDHAGQLSFANDDEIGFLYTYGETGEGTNRSEYEMYISPTGTNVSTFYQQPGEMTQGIHMNLHARDKGYTEYASPLIDNEDESVTSTGADDNANVTASSLANKRFFSQFTILSRAASYNITPSANAITETPKFEIFKRFNPLYYASAVDTWHSTPPNILYSLVASADQNDLINNYGMNLTNSTRNAYWGGGYDFATGSSQFSMLNIPVRPLYSLIEFSNANISRMAHDPMKAIGNSWNHIYVSPTSPYGQARYIHDDPTYRREATAADHSWLCNDAIFDRYNLSGITPFFDYTGTSGTYNKTGSIEETLKYFYQKEALNGVTHYSNANANPHLIPYIPKAKAADLIINELIDPDGYKKINAYSLLRGQFNVNSTSVKAWTALLKGNRNISVQYAQGSSSDSPLNDTPFPNSTRPSNPSASAGLTTQNEWSGLSRLDDSQVEDLATKIVEQVKLRGPFMSLSDFINHRVGTPIDTELSYSGAVQKAIDNCLASSAINSSSQNAAGSETSDYDVADWFQGKPPTSKSTTSGIPGEITQADILRPIAAKINARSDTFRIRAYGETLDSNGEIIATATCEALIQRFPEYIDTNTDANNNEPWDEVNNPHDVTATTNSLNLLNLQYGRKFKIISFRWL